ncbi:AAA family ATPase [Streptomyces sp. NPDC056690]|uniref:AAA family ATPase n=1 Tax=unclassified Streptomyces TaxID=2593676 RepID=UPI003645328E
MCLLVRVVGRGGRVTTVFVNRESLLEKAEQLQRTIAAGQQGGGVVVLGDSGMGKTALLERIAQRAAWQPGLRVVPVRCTPLVGRGSRFGPVLDVLLHLSATSKSARRRNWLGVLRRSAMAAVPDIASVLVPGAGGAIAAFQEAAKETMATGSIPGDSLMLSDGMVTRHLVGALLQLARDGSPVLVVIDDVQLADLGTLELLHLLVPRLSEAPMGLVLGLGPCTAPSGNEREVQALIERVQQHADRLVQVEELRELAPGAVRQLVHARLAGHDLPTEFACQVADATGGQPLFIDQVLTLWRPGYGTSIPFPDKLPDAFKERFGQLDPQAKDLLVLGATAGRFFFSHTLATVTGLPQLQIQDILHRIAQTHGLIRERRRSDMPHWAAQLHIDWYEFDHRQLQLGIREEQREGARLLRHGLIADALRAVPRPPSPDLPRALDTLIAEHLREAGPARALDSAQADLHLARALAGEELAFVQAEQFCRTAITSLGLLPEGDTARDRLLAEATELLLSLTEVRWRGNQSEQDPMSIDALAAEAEAAAHRVGDRLLIARMTLQRGKTLMAVKGLYPSLDKLEEAVDRARECGDEGVPALFVAMVEYGRQLPKKNLEAGLDVLLQAERLYASAPQLGAAPSPVLQHARNLNEMQIGINLHDSGCFDEARFRLERCVQRLEGEIPQVELPIALNYLAQLHLAIGADAAARATLARALQVEEERGGASGWHAYNNALLALLTARDPARADEAVRRAEAAWEETTQTWLANLVPIVRNLYTETLLATGRGLDRALSLTEETLAETARSRMDRSRIAAFCLRARLRLRDGEVDHDAAVADARAALELLGRRGDMPALRTEEVYRDAAAVLRAVGRTQEADALVQRARAVVLRKAASLRSAVDRHRFLTGVPLNHDLFPDSAAVLRADLDTVPDQRDSQTGE